MIDSLLKTSRMQIINALGYRTKRKIVLIESDDWGSIRVASRESLDQLKRNSLSIDRLVYNRYDALASEVDLASLFDVLIEYKDKNGLSPIITANTIVANPNFEKILASNFTEYHLEPFTETLKRYPEHHRSFELWNEGIAAGIFKPQLHGREHINVTRWMNALKENIGLARIAFDHCMYDLSTSLVPSENSFMEALNYTHSYELGLHRDYLVKGAELFEELFGYRSVSFIAPCFIWSNDLNVTLKECGISIIQGGFYQFHPTGVKLKKIFHYTGQRNSVGQCYLVRNVHFEPSENPSHDWVGSAMSQISSAFWWGRPAIISSHRMNYIGFIDPENRNRNLILLSKLLKSILERWPDVEFMSSDQLGTLILQNRE